MNKSLLANENLGSAEQIKRGHSFKYEFYFNLHIFKVIIQSYQMPIKHLKNAFY